MIIRPYFRNKGVRQQQNGGNINHYVYSGRDRDILIGASIRAGDVNALRLLGGPSRPSLFILIRLLGDRTRNFWEFFSHRITRPLAKYH